jgi:dinuclear metal center YbgI/SA1388 family protein
MLIREFIDAFDEELPLALAMKDDPVGLQVLAAERELSAIAVAYEVDERIVAHAAEEGAGLLIAFHPLIYPSLRRITNQTRVERSVVELIDRRIGLYIVHTAFDAHPEGTSALLAKRLGLMGIRPLIPDPTMPGAGMGAIGEFVHALELHDLAQRVREACEAPGVRISSPAGMPADPLVRSVAIVGGSGMSFYDNAVRAGADAFITADVRYHSFHAANDGIPVLDPGHAESESLVVDGLALLVERTVGKLDAPIRVIPIRESTNPVRLIV